MIEERLSNVVALVLAGRRATPPHRSTLVAVSGIDGAGKGHVSGLLSRGLTSRGLRVALINIDGWLALPETRFSREDPAKHFYLHAIRFDEMFERLVLPLRDRRSIVVEADFAEETAIAYRKHLYEFSNIDIILLEGIFLLKRQWRSYYDLSVWIHCSFETALKRAVLRAQEGLSPELTAEAYRAIYFPAQEIHFQRDDPRQAATVVIDNEESSRAEYLELDS